MDAAVMKADRTEAISFVFLISDLCTHLYGKIIWNGQRRLDVVAMAIVTVSKALDMDRKNIGRRPKARQLFAASLLFAMVARPFVNTLCLEVIEETVVEGHGLFLGTNGYGNTGEWFEVVACILACEALHLTDQESMRYE